MTQHADALRVLTGWQAPSHEQDTLRRSYVDHLHAHADGCGKPCFPDHLTAGVLVLSDDGTQVLLNLHRKAQRWFAFGGHIEPTDATLAEAALREGIEESGLVGLVVDPQPVHLSLHPVDFCQLDGAQPRGTVRHLDVRFAAVVPAGTEPVLSDESLDIRWFPVDDLPTDEPDMVELVRLARARFR